MSASKNPFIISGMSAANAPHEAPMAAFLDELIAEPSAHASFMNMLSMLEHMGSRKIMVSQMNRHETMDEDTLKHLAEEARHAYFFKRQAERVAGHAMPGWTDENTMARIPALMYFGRLDAGISQRVLGKTSSRAQSRDLDNQLECEDLSTSAELCSASGRDDVKGGGGEDPDNQCYPWVSMIIELRACWLYHIYHGALERSDLTLSLKSLLAEEDMHLAEMFEMVGENEDLLRELCAYETSLFEKFWRQIQKAHAAPGSLVEAA